MSNLKMKLKAGDKVIVIAGQYGGGKRRLEKGKKRVKTAPLIDYISRIDPQKQVVYLKGAKRKVYDKSTAETKKKSELKEVLVPIHISNVAYCSEVGEDKNKKQLPTKIGYQLKEEKNQKGEIKMKKVRIARKFKDKKGNNLLID